MATEDLHSALDRLEQACARLENAVSAQADNGQAAQELVALKVRHRKLKDTVAKELRQLDLLLSGLPQ